MSSSQLSPDPVYKRADETLAMAIDFTRYGLATSETLTGTPTVTATGLTAGAPAVNVSTFTSRRGGTVAIGKGVQFTLAGGTAGSDYDVVVTCGTTGGQTLSGQFQLRVRSS